MVFLAILALGFLIVVHEGGHYFVARWCGMRVERFSIGFGPGIFKRQSKKTGTIFQLAPIPFGGFVEIRGMNIAEEVDPEDRFAYPNRPAWQRFITIFAGPATNYVSAIFLAFGLYTCHGMEGSTYHVEIIQKDSDAATKLQPGDHIVKVDGVEQYGPTTEALRQAVAKKNGAPIDITVERDGKRLDFSLAPRKVVEKDKDGVDQAPVYRLGIVQQADLVDVGVVHAAGAALVYPIDQTKMIVGGLADIITGKEKADPGGPVRMVDEFKKAFSSGIVNGIRLLMVLSVYLGLFNLFPLPALDGGRLVFLGYEMVTRRRANPKIEATVHMGGIMVLAVVMVLVTLHDCGVI